MAELQDNLVFLAHDLLKDEEDSVRQLVLLLLGITMNKSKNVNQEITAKTALETEIKKMIATGVLDCDDDELIDLDTI